ncbi:MAG: flavodoxin family protein [Spirochaetales bacterium]|nr:flavodoxin family protein [Spirochaetales bacterium]
MKVIGINGSPRKNGNTAAMIGSILDDLSNNGIDGEIFQLGGNLVRGCSGCNWCKDNQVGRCVFSDDCINECIEKMASADAVIIGSPTYFSTLTTETKALIDRGGRICRSQGLLRRKVGAAVTPVRRAGSMNVFQSINNFFLIQEMIVPGSSYWNMSLAAAPGDYEKDEEGVKTMKTLAENISWLMGKLN